ncbi:MAG TPA: MerR family transcriptional regulator [Geminicoccaceae bacterium]|nr:MerR family transcriptional regulator [Geminicoccaceae bacterium]
MPTTEDELLRLVAGLRRRELRAWVESGWVRPTRGAGGEGVAYTEIDCARVRLIHELRRDLQVDDELLPLVLSLTDQIYGLRRELRRLAAAVQAEPEPVRRGIVERARRAGRD